MAGKKAADTQAAKHPGGRPTSYSQEIADELCALLAEDDLSLKQICELPGMPTSRTVYNWLRTNDEFFRLYARARQDQAHSSVYRLQELEGKVECGALEPNAARVIADSIKWRASKLLPKAYGDRIQHSGDPDAPIQHAVALDFSSLKPAERNALRGILEARNVEDAVPIEGEKSDVEDR